MNLMQIVLLTGFSEFEYAHKALKAGVYDYLLKPINPGELLNHIKEVKNRLERKRYKNELVKQQEEHTGSFDTVSLAELSERYFYSASYMSKKIKQETGYSFVEILNAIRLMNAVVYLQDGHKVNIASEKAGFNDQRYFSQVFRKTFGCSPTDYKKDISEEDRRLHVILEKIMKTDG